MLAALVYLRHTMGLFGGLLDKCKIVFRQQGLFVAKTTTAGVRFRTTRIGPAHKRSTTQPSTQRTYMFSGSLGTYLVHRVIVARKDPIIEVDVRVPERLVNSKSVQVLPFSEFRAKAGTQLALAHRMPGCPEAPLVQPDTEAQYSLALLISHSEVLIVSLLLSQQ